MAMEPALLIFYGFPTWQALLRQIILEQDCFLLTKPILAARHQPDKSQAYLRIYQITLRPLCLHFQQKTVTQGLRNICGLTIKGGWELALLLPLNFFLFMEVRLSRELPQ